MENQQQAIKTNLAGGEASTARSAVQQPGPARLLEEIVAETTAQKVYSKMGEPLVAAEKLGKWFAASGLFGAKSPEQGIVIALTCMTEGLTPLEFVRTFDIVEGKPSKKSAAMQAEFLRKGGRIEWIESTVEKCTARGWHPDYCPNGWVITRTLKELEESGVATCWDKEGKKRKLKDNYARSPAQMLRARVVAELVRMICPEINAGLYAPEELDDEKPEPGPAPAWAVPQPTTQDQGASTKTQEGNGAEPKNGSAKDWRAEVVTTFKRVAVLQEDLERFAGGFDVSVPLADWNEDHRAAFNHALDKIKAVPRAEQGKVAAEVFQLPPGSTVE